MIGQIFSHYKILDKIGEGGMGVVYKAQDMNLDRFVALKFLPEPLSNSEQDRVRFLQEAKAASALNHPNICTIHGIEEHDQQMFIVMEFIEGHELKEVIAREKPMSIDRCLSIVSQIAEGLKAAHAKGIVHRDIKSSNIMITPDGQVKIMDFGLAKRSGSAPVTKTGSTVGTMAYMSPEQARGEELDHRSDLWSLGVVFYELLTGRVPFVHEYEHAIMYSILNEEPKPVTELRPKIPDGLVRIINKSLTKDVQQRYQSDADFLNDLRSAGEGSPSTPDSQKNPGKTFRRRPKVIAVLLLIIAVTVAAIKWIDHRSNIGWARDEALPLIERTIQDGTAAEGQSAWTAFEMAEKARVFIPDDPLLARLYTRFSRRIHIYSDPSEATVYAKPYSDPNSEWRLIGRTPIDSVRFPLGFSRLKVEKAGSDAAYDLVWNIGWTSDTLRIGLAREGSVPEEMVLIPDISTSFEIAAAPAGLHMPGLEHLTAERVGSFLMDRYEVTNEQFKKFIDQGGYKERKFWKHPFIKDGREISWDDAMKLFTDKTGRHGPSTWEVGDFPTGKGRFPVSGVSWYEAAAFAEFAGKSLPTIHHWDQVAFTWASPVIVPVSNLRGEGPKEIGSSQSMNRYGLYDLGGNVREWCFNASNRGSNFILGGGWNDQPYAFNDAYAQSPFDRSETNGLRCIKYIGDKKPEFEKAIVLPFRDFMHEHIASDKEFGIYLNQYSYDKSLLNETVESRTEETDWIKERITFNAAYGGERMIAFLFLPKNSKPPYQTVVYFPGSGAIHTRSSDKLEIPRLDFLLKSGRAVIYPIYKSTYERGDALHSDYPDETNFWKEHVIMWAKDAMRSIDYLETRKEIDHSKIAYYGISWGGAMGGIIPAVDKRIKVSVLQVAGLLFQPSKPEADPLHFLPRFKTPVLMLNGKYDFFFPYETSQRPFFELLGTSKEHKRIISYDGGHSVPRTQLVKETLEWLDHYLGEVR